MENLGPDKDNEKTKKKSEKKEKTEKKGKRGRKSKQEKEKDNDKEENVDEKQFLNKKRGKEKDEEEKKEENEKENEEIKKKKEENVKMEEEEELDSDDIEKEKKFEEGIKLIEEKMINQILDYVKNDVFPNITPESYMDSYSAVKEIADLDDNKMPKILVEYHNKIILDFIIYCFNKFELESKSNFVDNFILYTKKIYTLIYWMNRIFTYLDSNVNNDKKNYKKLSIIGMDLYKQNFFDKIEDNVYKELNKLIKEDRNNNTNTEERDKIKTILETIKNLDYIIPEIIKEKNTIKWIEKKKNNFGDNRIQRKYGDKWFNDFFKKDTIAFAKRKAELDINSMSAPEYIREQLKYLDKENERKIDYIPSAYHKDTNDINYKYLVGEKAEEIAKKETGILYMFKNNQFEELQKVFELFVEFPYKEEKPENSSEEKNIIFNKVAKVLSLNFGNYILERGNNIFNNTEISKNPKLFIPELIKLYKEMVNFIINCFSNHRIYIDAKNKSFQKLMEKSHYAKQISNYIDFCMKSGFKGKSPEEVEHTLDDIIELYKCLENKLEFQNDSDTKMSNRLIRDSSLSINFEKSLISKLKQESGITYVHKKVTMMEDLELSRRIIDEYKQNSNSKGKPNGIKFDVRIISQGAWDINKNDYEKIKIPKYLDNCIEDFKNFYLQKNKDRKLIWFLFLSKVDIQYLCFPKKNISVSTLPQLLILLLLEKHKKLSVQKISELLECPANFILKDIPGLIYNPSFNPKGEKDKGLLLGNFNTETKEFTLNDEIEFNYKFFYEKQKFITLPLMKSKTSQQLKDEEEINRIAIKKNEEYIIQGTLTRIMKSRIGQVTTHTWLVNEVFKQIDLFRAQPQQIKENIEKLIGISIMKRSETDRSCYEYIA